MADQSTPPVSPATLAPPGELLPDSDGDDALPAPGELAEIARSSPPDLPYQSLYRRFRPQRFLDVRGQDHVTRPLLNAVREGRVAHAYLFSGPRGTGKTSTARILAMALNCTDLQDGEPCGVCESCGEIRRGSSLDVHELDAASNRKLDEMRDLLSRVALGTPGRWKVYIVDEVHQLTPDAASALLKTLEEPPGHVVFVLATTDPQKVLPTIRSRTLHFEFHLLASDVLGELLRDVNIDAGLGVAPEAIDLVVRRGHGSARDALTVLDQVAAAGVVEDEATVVAEVVDGLADRDAGRVLLAVAEAIASGRDPRRLAADVLDHLRNGFLATMAKGLVMLPDEAALQVEAQARRLGLGALVRAMEGIGEALAEMRDSVDPRVTLEVALVRLARPEADPSPAALLERIERLERAVAGGSGHRGDTGGVVQATSGPPTESSPARPQAVAGNAPSPVVTPAAASRSALGAHRPPSPPPAGRATPPVDRTPPPSPRAAPPAPPDTPLQATPAAGSTQAGPGGVKTLPSRDELTKAWGDGVLQSLPGKARSRFASGRFLSVDGGAAVFAVPDKHMLIRCEEVRGDAEAALAARFGGPVPLRLVLDPGGPAADGPGSSADGLAAERPTDMEESADPYDLDQFEDTAPALASPEQRLLEAFPGAEEVSS